MIPIDIHVNRSKVRVKGQAYRSYVGEGGLVFYKHLFLYCNERDFMSQLHKSKRYDLIYVFTDTSGCIYDIFTTNNPESDKHIPDIYQTELQLNKADTSDKEQSILDLNIKLMGMTFIPAFTTNALDSDFLSSISPGWVVMFLHSHRTVVG